VRPVLHPVLLNTHLNTSGTAHPTVGNQRITRSCMTHKIKGMEHRAEQGVLLMAWLPGNISCSSAACEVALPLLQVPIIMALLLMSALNTQLSHPCFLPSTCLQHLHR